MVSLKITSIVGTRPEAIKMAPLVVAIARHQHMSHQLIATGQQDALFDDAIAAFTVTVDLHLGHHPGGDMEGQLLGIEAAVATALKAQPPDLVLVQGDTNTALAAARAARKLDIVVGHVEAGLRSHNPAYPFPEEYNRIEIARHASLHFAPSDIAAQNLADEDVFDPIFVTGNTCIDAVMAFRAAETMATKSHILVTCHRRENFGAPLLRICDALIELSRHTAHPILIPVHPNPHSAAPLRTALSHVPKIQLIAPMAYPEMLVAIQKSLFVITDSGGLQEECAALGIPLLLLRGETERPEVIANGNAIMVGSDPKRIVEEAVRLIGDRDHHSRMSVASFPYGMGNAASKIVAAIEQHFRTNC